MIDNIRLMHMATKCIAGIFLELLLTVTAFPQSCNASINIDPQKTIVVEAWDGSGESTVMSCKDAESLRAQIFVQQLAYLSDAQSISATRVNTDITDAINRLKRLRQALANARNDEEARGISATIKSMQWVAAKAKLLICALETIESDGLGFAACGKPLISFLKQSNSTFKEFSSVSEAQDQARGLQELINQMQNEIKKIGSTNIDGSVTAQRYSLIFQNLCSQ